MGFFEVFGILVFLYFVISILLWILLDSDIQLFVKLKFGLPISSLNGKVAWITGASSGIGKHLALVLAKNGVRLILSARREIELEKVKEECLAISGLQTSDILLLKMDMLEIDKHEVYFKMAIDHFNGQLDILINNAGRSQRAKWEDINISVDRDIFELDAFSGISLARIYVRYLEKHTHKGHLVVTSSAAGILPIPMSASYCAAKSCINTYYKCLKVEKPHVDVTIICPGLVYTKYLPKCFTHEPDEPYGRETNATEKRMTPERCAYLMATAIANKVLFTYMGKFPLSLMANIFMYYPNIGQILLNLLGIKRLKNLRDPENKQ